jgi:exopolysaccharide production protein ExoZ
MLRGTPVLLSIQALRALAALAVVAYHALQWDRGGFDVGRAGVDVFFVISGLIMWHVTSGRDVPPAAFLWRRFTRVAPLYWLATVGVLVVAVLWPAFLPEVRPGWGHLALSLAFIPHLDPRGLPFPTLPPGWTLDYEAAFYLIFAAALLGPRAWRGRLVVGALMAVTAFGFLVAEPYYYLGANPMLLQFAAGVGLGIAVESRLRPPRWMGAAMILTALAGWTTVQAGGLFTELWRPLLWGVPAFLTVAGALTLELNPRAQPLPAPAARAARGLGDASYAIYILHLPATALVAHTLGWSHPWLFLSAAMAASIAAGLAGRAWVEKPLLRWLRAARPPATFPSSRRPASPLIPAKAGTPFCPETHDHADDAEARATWKALGPRFRGDERTGAFEGSPPPCNDRD